MSIENLATHTKMPPGQISWLPITTIVLILAVAIYKFTYKNHTDWPFLDAEGGGTMVGMDIGNSYSRVGYIKGGKTWYSEKIPSCVSFEVDGSMNIGSTVDPPGQTFCGFKRLVGFYYEEIEERIANLPFTVLPRKGRYLEVEISDNERQSPKRKSINVLMAALMGKLRHMAEKELGTAVTSAILVVPANVPPKYKLYTRRAAKVIGLHIEKFVSEPMAAVVSNEYTARTLNKTRRMNLTHALVIGVGGSHYDVGFIDVGNYITLNEIWSGGGQIGGDDITFRISEIIYNNFRSSEQEVTARMESEVKRRIKREAERIKRVLTTNSIVEYVVELPRDGSGKMESIRGYMTSNEVKHICAPMFLQIMTCVKYLMETYEIEPEEEGKVILTGRGVGLPGLKKNLKYYFPNNTFLEGGEWGLHGAMLLAASTSLRKNLRTSLTETISFQIGTGKVNILAEKGLILPHENTIVFIQREKGTFSEMRLYSEGNSCIAKRKLWGTLQLRKNMVSFNDRIEIDFKVTIDRCIEIQLTNEFRGETQRGHDCDIKENEDYAGVYERDWLLSKLGNHFESEKTREECDRLRQQVYLLKSSILRGEFGTVLAKSKISELSDLAEKFTQKVKNERLSRIECNDLLTNFAEKSAEIQGRSFKDEKRHVNS